MAKKNNQNRVSSNENLKDMLNSLRRQAYSPESSNYSGIVTDLPTDIDENPIENTNISEESKQNNLQEYVSNDMQSTSEEPVYEVDETQEDNYSEENGFITKLRNALNNIYNSQTEYWSKSSDEVVKEAKNPVNSPFVGVKDQFKTILDPTFATIEGFVQGFIDAPAGKMMLNNKKLNDLNFQKEFLETEQDMKDLQVRLNKAVHDGNTEEIKALTAPFEATRQVYISMLDDYRKMAGSNEYYDKYGKQKSRLERLDAIRKGINELEQDNAENSEDLQSGRDLMHKVNDIYKPSKEWKELESKDWLYQIPRGMGTSFTSIGANLSAFATQAAANYMASAAIANTGGAYGNLIAGGAAILGAGVTTAANIYARNQESLQEVSNNYKQNVLEYASKNGINTSDIAKVGREQLQKLTGEEYSEDPNSENYRSDDEVFEDMLAYDIALNNDELDRLTATSKKNLQDIYNRNMALSLSDVAQSAIIIPGAGKAFGQLLGKLNLPERAVNGTVKTLDKIIESKIGNSLSKASKKKISKHILDPAVRMTASALMEGVEETTQYVIGSKINKDKESDPTNLYNPFDIAKLFVQNQYDALKGIAAIAGVSGDPALDNDEELVNNFKVGVAIGFLMGGSTQTVSAANNYRSFSAGQELARNTMVDYISSKEDIYKYSEYAKHAMNKFYSKDAFLDGVDTQINDQQIPDGFTIEDLNNEKKNIEDIYNIVNNYKVLKNLNKEDKAIGAALIKHYDDELKKAVEANKPISPELFNSINKDVNDFINRNNLDNNYYDIVNTYLSTKTQLEAIQYYIKTIDSFNSLYANDNSIDFRDNLYIKESQLKQSLNDIKSIINDSNDDNLKKLLNEDTDLYTSSEELKRYTIQNMYTNWTLNKSKDKYTSILYDKNTLKNDIQKYKDSEQNNNTVEPSTEEEVIENESSVNEDGDFQEPAVESTSQQPSAEVSESNTITDDKEETKEVKDVNATEDVNSKVTPEQKEESNEETTNNDVGEQNEEKPASRSFLSRFSQYDEKVNDYDGYNEGSDEKLNENDFAEEYSQNNTESADEEVEQKVEQNKITEEDINKSLDPIVPETKEVTFDNDKASNSITEEQVELSKVLDSDEVNDDINLDNANKGLVYGTLFYNSSENTPALKEGYEKGSELNKYLSTPGNLSKSKITAFVEPADYKYGKYDPSNKATWDNAAIRIVIESPEGKKYIASFKTIDGAKMLYINNGRQITDFEEKELEDLRSLRNTIIEAKLNDPNAEIQFKSISMTNGVINRSSINRNLLDIKGLNLNTSTLFDLDNSDIKFGIGKGVIGNFIIADKDGMILKGKGGSGKIFIYPRPEDTLNGEEIPIQLNELRFGKSDEDVTDLSRFLARMFLYRETGNPEIYFEDLEQLMLHYGEYTLVDTNDDRYPFLKNKQFYINYKENWVQLGEDRVLIRSLRNKDGEERVARFIQDNLHWNTEKNLLWKPLPSSIKEYMLFHNVKELEIAPGIKVDYTEVGLADDNGTLKSTSNGLTTLAWMIKNGILKANLEDQIFTSPFVYVSDPIISHPVEEQPKQRSFLSKFSTSDSKEEYNQPVEPTIEEEAKTEEKNDNYDPYTDVDSEEVRTMYGLDSFTVDFDKEQGPTKRMKISSDEDYKKINTKKAVKWLKKTLNLSDDNIEIVDGIIKQFANGEAVYGIAKLDGIAISNMAIEGVQYHEAWHRVSLLLLDEDTRNRLYKEFIKQHPNMANMDNKQIEEAIADSFMDYMLNDKENTLRYYINKIFRNIKNILGFGPKLNRATLNQVFDMIKYGDFKKYQMDEKSKQDFLNSYEKGAYYKVGPNNDVTLQHFPTPYDFESTLDSLKSALFISNGVKMLSDIDKLNEGKLKLFLQSISKSKLFTEQQKEAINEIIDKFDIFMYHLRPKLEQMGIRKIDDSEYSERESIENGDFNQYDKAGFEFDKKNNALASVKMFIATIEDSYYEYREVNGVNVKDVKTRRNNITGLPMIVDYDTAYSQIIQNLSTVENYSNELGKDPNTSLIGRCARLSRHNPFFATLYRKLLNVKDSNLETQILQTIKSQDQNFIEINYNTDNKGNTTFEVKDSINKKAARIFPSTWSDIFFNSEMVIHNENESVPNKNNISNIIKEFNNLFKQVNDNKQITNTDTTLYIKELVKILNNIGILVDDVTVESLLNQDNRTKDIKDLICTTKSGSLYQLFNGTLQSMLGGKVTYSMKNVPKVRSLNNIFIGLGNNSIVNILANAQSLTHPEDTNISVLGPNNNIVYTKTLNCYVSDLLRWINENDEYTMASLNNDPYCRSSLILNAANNGNKLRLNTYLNFQGDKYGDRGRGYLEISPIEDYMSKMSFTWNNHIIFPTMADKKTWFTITGVKLFNREMDIRQDGNRMKFRFNHEALRYLYKAWEDEFNAIVNYYNTLSSVKAPIKNYHTSGKGGLFRHFTGYYANINGVETWVDLNEQIKNALKFDKNHRSSLMLRSVLEDIREKLFTNPEETLNKINNNLLYELKQELSSVEELGIISKEDNTYKNKLLDNDVFQHFVNIYKANVNDNISRNAEKYAIFTMIGNHMINQNVSVLETEKIITGDVAFYKNDDDKIKRLGAVLSTGDNLRTQWITDDPDKQNLYRKLNNRQTYTCAIFNDNEIPSAQYDYIKELFKYDRLLNLLTEKENLSEEYVDEILKDENKAKEQYPEIFALAETLAEEDANAYGLNSKKTKGNINQADAAVYIRPEMYQQIVRRLGEWSTEVEEAFNILESDTDWLSDKKLYAKSLKTLIKALKTTYFGYTYNADLGYNVPVFNKMAMFPMFKALATGDNREIYDRMNAVGKYKGLQPIDQIAFESAVKVGIEGGHNFYKDYTNNSINDMTNIHTTTQYFRNLRRQLITDPHTHDRTLFGTQVSTVAVSNLKEDRLYGNGEKKISGARLKQNLFGTINAISNKGIQQVINEYTTDGKLDLKKTSESLVQEAKASNMGKNMEDALKYNKDTNDFEVSLSALPDSKWVETKVISRINKKAIDLELPGGAFIQMSSFGFKSIKTVGSNAIAGGKRLVNINPDGSMDAIISINLFRSVIPNFDKISFTEAKKWLIEHRIIGDNAIPTAIGYRIPTQGLSSIAGIRIKDVLPSNVGDMIVLPDEFTTQTGSDLLSEFDPV